MKRLMELAVKLYPVAWRQRYEAEFAALLEDVQPGWWTLLNICKGALAMQLRALASRSGIALTAVAGVVGLLIGLTTAIYTPKQFVSTALLRAPADWPNRRPEIRDRAKAAVQAVLSRATLVNLIGRYGLYADKKAKMPLEDALKQLRAAIVISGAMAMGNWKNGNVHPALVIRFRYADPKVAKMVVEDLTARFGGELLDPASAPRAPIYPNPNFSPLLD